MSIIIVTNLLSGATGLDKSVVMTANALRRRGGAVSILNIVGTGDGTSHLVPRWPIDDDVPVMALQTLPAEGGRHLHQNLLPVIQERIPNLRYTFTQNALAALRQLNWSLTESDALVFTHPLQAHVLHLAIGDDHRRCRTVLQIHGDYRVRHPELRPMLLEARSVIDELQVVSNGLERDYLDHFDAEAVHWIPNIHEPGDVIRRSTEIPRIVLVGSFQDAKNQLDAVQMMERLRDVECELVLWGKHDNAYGAYVRQYAERVGVADRVRFAGVGSEHDIYGSADVVVIPSRSEGFGYALVEAAAHRIPVVAYDYRYGPRDVIEHGVSGYIVPEGDVDTLADHVARLLGDPERRRAFGDAARAVFDSTFRPDHIVARYEELLGPSLGGSPIDRSAFPVEGVDPVDETSLRARPVTVAGRAIGHVLSFSSRRPIRRFQIESSKKTRRVRPLRVRRRHALFVLASDPGRRVHRARQRVVSYELTAEPELGRFYLANTTTRRRMEVGRHMLRRPTVDVATAIDDLGVRLTAEPDDRFCVVDGRAHLAQHPRRPVVAGRDNFGVPLNTPGGVELRLTGDVRRPATIVNGEFDRIDFGVAGSFAPPFGYGELIERLERAEVDGGLYEIEVLDGVRPWELYRAAFIATLAGAIGLWGPHFSASSGTTWDTYLGDKTLRSVPGSFDRVLFEFPRRPPGVDPRTAALQDAETLVIEHPQAYGYSKGVYTERNRYPIREFNLFKRESKIAGSTWVNARPFEAALSAAFEFPIDLAAQLDWRVTKFLQEREFWRPVFDGIAPSEVMIPSSHWSAGICVAARDAGAVVADIQYALTSRYHPSFWFPVRPAHGAGRLYAWAPFWCERTNAYTDYKTFQRPGFAGLLEPPSAPRYDVGVLSQPRVSRRILRFVEGLAAARPELRIAVCPHPDERAQIADQLRAVDRLPNVEVVNDRSTLDVIRESSMCVGGYSTSMYEAAAHGIPTFVLAVPGHEILASDIEDGLFRIVRSFEELKPFNVPRIRHDLFATRGRRVGAEPPDAQ